MSGFASIWQIGPAVAGQILGTPYNWLRPYCGNYEITPISGILSAWLTTDPKGQAVAAPQPGKAAWYAWFDPSQTQPGDYLVGDFGTFFINSQYLPAPIALTWCNSTINLYRPIENDAPGVQGYAGNADVNGMILSSWPVSILQNNRREAGATNLPGDAKMGYFDILLPLSITGMPQQADIIDEVGGQARQFIVSASELSPIGWRVTAIQADT